MSSCLLRKRIGLPESSHIIISQKSKFAEHARLAPTHSNPPNLVNEHVLSFHNAQFTSRVCHISSSYSRQPKTTTLDQNISRSQSLIGAYVRA
uniref:Ovule protein n=1 Tax=Steinernema glaseri TaxID=37863 RepID=A0A1I7ZA21_9BILA